MDDEVLEMINEQYARAKQILTEHKKGHEQLADLLFQKEVIFAEDVENIFGKRQWVSRSEEIFEANQAKEPKLEDMPDSVKQAQAEHEKAITQQEPDEQENKKPAEEESNKEEN